MNLTLKAICGAIWKALRDSAEILAACQNLYERPHSVYYGSWGPLSAAAEDYPAFTVLGWEKDRSAGDDDRDRLFQITVGLDIHDETSTEAVTAEGVKTVTYRGMDTLEDLLDLAMAVIEGISTEIIWTEKVFSFEPLENFPVFVGEITLTAAVPILIGGAEPILS